MSASGSRTLSALRRFIQDNLPLTPAPSIPEIRLHTAHPASGLGRLAQQDQAFGSPYWAYPWAGGLALARHVLDHPQIVKDRRVLDLGAGSGLVAIAAAKAGADRVIAADTDPYALTATGLNAAENGVAVTITSDDLTRGSPPDVDVVLVGDLFYAPDLAERVIAFLGRCADAGVQVLIGDRGRADLPRGRLLEMASYPVHDVGEPSSAVIAGGVFTLIPPR